MAVSKGAVATLEAVDYKLLACGAAVASTAALPASVFGSQRRHRPHAPAIIGVVVHESNTASGFVVAERSDPDAIAAFATMWHRGGASQLHSRHDVRRR